MASTSASSIQKRLKYDVLLSFRGEDTRKSFVDHLYHALKQKGIYTYRDDEEIKKGERISDELIRSIEDSKFYVIVFSKNYASSSWCLDELVKIMECQKMNEHTAYPVFYDVEPTEVRKQSGAVGESFSKHEEAVVASGRWRDALKEAADLAGWDLNNTFDGHEAKLIQKIVEEISLELRFINSSIDGKLIGMETRVEEVVSYLETDIEDVRLIGIKGMGGAGKTTLARVVFDRISFRFDGSSFVENVREISKNPLCGLKSLQKQVLSDVLDDPNIIVNAVYEGKNMMKKRMMGRKVLVVLDDVDHIDQLEALVGEPNIWLKPGSRVIITTRDKQVLVAHRVSMILDVNLLSHEEAICLFSRYAFGRDIPIKGYAELSKQVVRYAAGLPLTIRVLASTLCGKDELEWADAIERLKTIPLKETLDKLELSYNSLEPDYKEIFLNVACILKSWRRWRGRDMEEAIRALESCGLHARSGLRVLEQKSLITLSGSGRLGMHDHIEEMGKNIVRRLHPNEPYKHSRLWVQEEVKDILVEKKGTEATYYIKVQNVDPVIVMKGLRKMNELKFLDVICGRKDGFDSEYVDYDLDSYYSTSYHDGTDLDYKDINGDSLYLPNGLQYISWDGYPFTSLPKNFKAINLVGLKLCFSNIEELWEGGERKVLKKLRFVDLFDCKLRTLDIGFLPNLERLNLEACKNLAEFHMPDEMLKLKHLSLRRLKLKSLNLKRTQFLERLDLQCEDLAELNMPVEHFKLKSLTLHHSKLKGLNIGRARNLSTLNFRHNKDLVELHLPVDNLKRLRLSTNKYRLRKRTHDFVGYEDLLELHMHNEIPELKIIYLSWSELINFNLTQIQNHEKLGLVQGEDFLEHPNHMESPQLKIIYICQMSYLNLALTRNPDSLDLLQCEHLLELHMPSEIHELKTIYIRCMKLKTLILTGARNLERLDLLQCKALLDLHMPIESPKLKIIYVDCLRLKTLDLTGARNLEKLDLVNYQECLELHMPIESPELKIINVQCSNLRILNLTGAGNLERLDLIRCGKLQELHMPVESPRLKIINIDCSELRTLYLGLSPCLEHLDLHDCFTLVEIYAPIRCGYVRFNPLLVNQGFPLIGFSAELHLIVRPFGICPLHIENSSPKFHFECIYRELLPPLSRNLGKLISFDLCACTNLAGLSGSICSLQCLRKLTLEGSIPEVPTELAQLECLEELTLLKTDIERLPDSICTLKDLKFLQVKSCRLLKQLPEDLGRLECLEELHLIDCTSLRDIPKSICDMKRLKCFHLIRCIQVEKLPMEIGFLPCLKDTYIEGTSIIDPPESLFQLKGQMLFIS